ncbi:MAG: hypothetical protein ACFB5Z_11120 [Elainellaceae cyanobacterium]
MPNLLLQQTFKPLLSCASLLLLWISAAGAGWLIAAFDLPWYGWLGIAGTVLYLCQVGLDGIAVANVGLIFMMSLATLKKSWPAVLGGALPGSNSRLWAAALIAIWIGAILWLYLLVYGRTAMQKILRYSNVSMRHAASLLTLSTLSAGFVGWFIYSLTPYLDAAF